MDVPSFQTSEDQHLAVRLTVTFVRGWKRKGQCWVLNSSSDDRSKVQVGVPVVRGETIREPSFHKRRDNARISWLFEESEARCMRRTWRDGRGELVESRNACGNLGRNIPRLVTNASRCWILITPNNDSNGLNNYLASVSSNFAFSSLHSRSRR